VEEETEFASIVESGTISTVLQWYLASTDVSGRSWSGSSYLPNTNPMLALQIF
jgi:hypothetical protein